MEKSETIATVGEQTDSSAQQVRKIAEELRLVSEQLQKALGAFKT